LIFSTMISIEILKKKNSNWGY